MVGVDVGRWGGGILLFDSLLFCIFEVELFFYFDVAFYVLLHLAFNGLVAVDCGWSFGLHSLFLIFDSVYHLTLSLESPSKPKIIIIPNPPSI